MDLTSALTVFATCGVVFMMHGIKGCNGQELIGPSPAIQAALRGDPHTLTCSRGTGSTSPVSWNDAVPGDNVVLISLGSDILTVFPKYTDNFAVESSNADEFNLAISNIAVEDEGFYYCQLVGPGESSQTVTLTVEVQSSSMSMTQNGNPVDTSNPVIVTVGETSAIVCTALGARPMVDILWFHLKDGEPNNKVEITTGVTQTNTSYADGTSDTVSTLQYTPGNNEYDDGTIRCESTGQLVATPVNAAATLSVQYIPVVSVQYGGDKAICSSDANPDVPLKGYADMEGYIFIVNNTDVYAPTECSDGQCTLNLVVKFNTDVRCNATNSIGTGFATTVAIPGAVITTTPEPTTPGRGTTIGGEVICNDTIYVAFLVILSLLLVASVAFNIVVFIRYNRLLNAGKTSDTQMESRTPEPTNQDAVATGRDNYQELNVDTRVKEHAYQQPNSSGLPQRVENEQGPMYEDLNNSSNDNPPTYEVARDELKAGGNQQSHMYVNTRPTRPRHGKHDK